MATVNRESELEHWIANQRGDLAGPWIPASSDASFRRYFRVPLRDGGSLIAMDAPPPQEDTRPFLDVAARLHTSGLHVPTILAADTDRGFVLMTDLGAAGYLDRLAADGDRLLGDAFDALLRMQRQTPTEGLPDYDESQLRAELDLFPTWFVRQHLGMAPDAAWWRAWETSCRALLDSALAQPRVFVHRDFMARNLMVAAPNPGVLDFQDALRGPIAYDPICLLRDAFWSWAPEVEEAWLRHYHERALAAGLPLPVSFTHFRRAADLMGAQRHLKVLGIFARLCHRDGKPDYIADAPRFLDYLERETAPYPELAPLRELLDALAHERVGP